MRKKEIVFLTVSRKHNIKEDTYFNLSCI